MLLLVFFLNILQQLTIYMVSKQCAVSVPTRAGMTQTATAIQNVNRTNTRAALADYTTNLVAHMRANQPGATLQEIIGGKLIDPSSRQLRQTRLPYLSFIIDEWYTDIPAKYNTTLRIQYLDIDRTFNSADIYGRRLMLWNDEHATQPALTLDGELVGMSNLAATPGATYDITFSVDHPYGAVDGTYQDQTGTQQIKAGEIYFIANGWAAWALA